MRTVLDNRDESIRLTHVLRSPWNLMKMVKIIDVKIFLLSVKGNVFSLTSSWRNTG